MLGRSGAARRETPPPQPGTSDASRGAIVDSRLPPMSEHPPALARRLGAFDAAMIVMGGMVGAGIFVNPAVVAHEVPSPTLSVLAWATGGAIALLGAFLYAELAERLPEAGG